MRHLGSLVLCLILAPVIYLLTGTAVAKWVEAEINSSGTKHYTALSVAILAALFAGGLYGVLVLMRLSPVGTVLAGLVFLGVAFWAMFDRKGFLDTMPSTVLGVRGAAGAAGPVTAVLAVPLLMTVFSPRRWRRWGNAPAAVAPSPGYSPPPTMPLYGTTQYSYNSVEPSSPAGAYSPPGSPVGFTPSSPYSSGDDPEATRRL